MKSLLLFILLFPAYALSVEPLDVIVSPIKPFAYPNEEGGWSGISIELVNKVAEDLNRPVTYTVITNVEEVIIRVGAGKYDMGVGAVSITSDREKLVDFSTPYFVSGLGIATKQNFTSTLNYIIKIIRTILIFIAFVFLGGILIRYLEDDKENEDLDSIAEGTWWSIVTLTTTGYGDAVPRTMVGRLFASLWMVIGMLVVPVMISNMSVSMTLDQFETVITDQGDLDSHNIGVIKGTSTETYFKANGIPYTSVNDITHMLDSIDMGRIDGGVYDLPMLQFHARKYPDIVVLPQTLNQEFYGLVLPPNSELRESTNISILNMLSTYEWAGIKAKYLGTQ